VSYIKVQGKWNYLYRAVDKHGKSHLALPLLRREDPRWKFVQVRSSQYLTNRQDRRAGANDRVVSVVLQIAVGRIDLGIDIECALVSGADFLRYVDQGLYACLVSCREDRDRR
jgi:hypothetical protein